MVKEASQGGGLHGGAAGPGLGAETANRPEGLSVAGSSIPGGREAVSRPPGRGRIDGTASFCQWDNLNDIEGFSRCDILARHDQPRWGWQRPQGACSRSEDVGRTTGMDGGIHGVGPLGPHERFEATRTIPRTNKQAGEDLAGLMQ